MGEIVLIGLGIFLLAIVGLAIGLGSDGQLLYMKWLGRYCNNCAHCNRRGYDSLEDSGLWECRKAITKQYNMVSGETYEYNQKRCSVIVGGPRCRWKRKKD